MSPNDDATKSVLSVYLHESTRIGSVEDSSPIWVVASVLKVLGWWVHLLALTLDTLVRISLDPFAHLSIGLVAIVVVNARNCCEPLVTKGCFFRQDLGASVNSS